MPEKRYLVTLTKDEKEILKEMTNPAASSGVSSLERKFIVLAGAIPR